MISNKQRKEVLDWFDTLRDRIPPAQYMRMLPELVFILDEKQNDMNYDRAREYHESLKNKSM